jgi:hypothetical protein
MQVKHCKVLCDWTKFAIKMADVGWDQVYANYLLHVHFNIRGCIQKFPVWVDNEINNNKSSLRSNTKGYGVKTHYTDPQNCDTTAPTGRELYHYQFSLQAASPETFGYTLLRCRSLKISMTISVNIFREIFRFLITIRNIFCMVMTWTLYSYVSILLPEAFWSRSLGFRTFCVICTAHFLINTRPSMFCSEWMGIYLRTGFSKLFYSVI